MEENKSKEGKKSSSSFIIVVLLMIICLGVGYFISAKDIITIGKEQEDNLESSEVVKEDTMESKQPEITVYDTTDEKITELIATLENGMGCFNIENYVKDNKVVANDISNERAYLAAERKFSNEQKSEISLDEYTKAIQSIFGKNYKFNPESVDYNSQNCPAYKYDIDSKKFVKQETACGGTCGPSTNYLISKAVDTDGVLEVNLKVAFFKTGAEGYFADYARTNKITNSFENIVPYGECSTYKFTFNKEDGNYVFVSSEPVK